MENMTDTILSIAALALGTGVFVKILHFTSQHGKYVLMVESMWEDYMERSRRALKGSGLAQENSPLALTEDALRERVLEKNYTPDPEMERAFTEMVDDPNTPTDDGVIWATLIRKFGAKALYDEAAKLDATPEETPALWAMSIRLAKAIGEGGASIYLRRIGMIRD